MLLSVTELIRALPSSDETLDSESAGTTLPISKTLREASLRPVPIGRLRRLSLLGSLQAKVAAAYLFHWCRGWFKSTDENQRLLAETHWRTAIRVLDSMGYLRGAVMKLGQTLANFPDIAPREFVETLDQLHFDAPPMHWLLLREMVANELGDDPERLCAKFDRHAFAAASLGQVHRARLWQICDRAMTTGRPEDRTHNNRLWCEITDQEAETDRMHVINDYADWCWRSRYCGGEYDFGDEADFRQGVDLFFKIVRRRYSRAKPCTPVMARSQFGWRSILYRLRAKIDIAVIAEQEVKATGWDRSAYAPGV